MGLVICKKHELSGMVLNCSHLSELVRNFESIKDFVKRVEQDTDDIEDKFKIDWIYCLCRICDKEYPTNKIDEFPQYFLKPVCAKCFKELSNLESWK